MMHSTHHANNFLNWCTFGQLIIPLMWHNLCYTQWPQKMGPRFLLYVAFIVAKMHKWRVIHNRSIQLSTLSTWMDCSNHKSNAFLRGLLRRTTSKNASNFRKRYFCETQVGLWGCAWSYAWDIGHSSISKIYSLPLRTEKEKDDDSRFYHTCHKS